MLGQDLDLFTANAMADTVAKAYLDESPTDAVPRQTATLVRYGVQTTGPRAGREERWRQREDTDSDDGMARMDATA